MNQDRRDFFRNIGTKTAGAVATANYGDSLLNTQNKAYIFRMSRLPRIVIPGYPHHVTQRGSRRAQTFFNKED